MISSSIQPSSSLPSSTPNPGVKVTALVDGTEEVVEPFAVMRVDSLEQAKADAGSQLDASVLVYRAGATPKEKVLHGLKGMAMELAGPVAGFMIGGPVGLAVGSLVAAGMWVMGVGPQALGDLSSAAEQHKIMPGPDWKGSRTYDIAADKGPGIDSAALATTTGEAHPNGADFKSFVASSLDPNRTNVVFAVGHGLGYHSTASLPIEQFKDAMETAAAKNGKKADVLVLESCLMSNVEALNELKDSAHVAIVSEESLAVDALPVREMMTGAALQGGTAQEIGRRMVETASQNANISTIAAIDLDRMEPFMRNLDVLGSALNQEIASGHKADIQHAAKQAQAYPQGAMELLNRKLIHFSDFGGFLDGLTASANLSADTKKAVADTKQTFADLIIAHHEGKGYEPASGVSFQSAFTPFAGKLIESNPEMSRYDAMSLPQSWKTLIHTLGMKGS
jgi:Clostripain family